MRKSLLVFLIMVLMVGFNTTNQILSSSPLTIASGNILGTYVTENNVYYTIKDTKTKLFSIYSYDIETGETNTLAKGKSLVNMFPLANTNNIYAHNNSFVWMETIGLWAWNGDSKNAIKLNNLPFNNGLSFWNNIVVFNDNWRGKKSGIYMINITKPNEEKNLDIFKYKQNIAMPIINNGYVSWVDKNNCVNEDDVIKTIGGNIKLYDISNDKIVIVDDSEKKKNYPIIQKNYVIYLEYKDQQYTSYGANIVAYNINTKEKKYVFEGGNKSLINLTNNPDSDYIIFKYYSSSKNSLKAIKLDSWEIADIAQSENIVNNFRLNSQMSSGKQVIYTQNVGDDHSPNWVVNKMQDISNPETNQEIDNTKVITSRVVGKLYFWYMLANDTYIIRTLTRDY